MKNTLEIKPDISYKSAGKFEETRFEKIHNEIFKNSVEASKIVAQEIADLIRSKQESNENCV
ncbi:glucosamine-6-phosphate deaminase, partial [Flavobacterium succinicans]